MREIKFKAWLPSIKKMTYEHSLDELMNWNTKVEDNGTAIWLQYTGLKDKNGKEIFEGDIVQCWGGEYCQGFWEHSALVTIKDFIYDTYGISEYEYLDIIGNIYENPELLKI